ncbi:MAG: PEP-CTERM sorting domain-containing protein [Burkholderiales bacterium]|nr:PEP-CTERM sorting domain-containing protein [Burkholderiales bacterium]
MNRFGRVISLVAGAVLYGGVVHAAPVDLGQVSLDWGAGGTTLPWGSTLPNSFLLYRTGYSTTGYVGDYPADPDSYLNLLNAGTATITAEAGHYITKAFISLSYGSFNNFSAGGSLGTMDWTFHGAGYSGAIGSTGGPVCPASGGIYRCWEIVSSATGRAESYGGLWFTGRFPEAGNNPTGYYSVNATSFSVDLKQALTIWGGGPFNAAETMGFELYVETMAGVPPVSSVPEPEQHALLMFGLLAVGYAGRRRGKSRAI